MSLRDFLEQHQQAEKPALGPRTKIASWRAAAGALASRFRRVLENYNQLQLSGWNVLREHAGIRYSIEALTIEFEGAVITLEPNAIEPEPGILGRAIVNCGVREVHIDCGADGELWRYHWVIPRDPRSLELTDAAIEALVEELLKSAAA